MNPLGTLCDASLGNEIEDRMIHIGGKRGERTHQVMPWQGIES
jgi:hypothetical protein